MSEPTPRRQLKRSCFLGCAGALLATLACAAVVWMVFSHNNRVPEIVVPTPAVPVNNAYDDFVRAGKLAVAMKHHSPYSIPSNQPGAFSPASFAACAQEGEPILRLLHTAVSKPCLVPPCRSFAGIDVSDFAGLRELARLTAGAAEHYWTVGDNGRSAEILLDCLEMSVQTKKGAYVMVFLVSSAIHAIVARQLERLIPMLSAADLEYAAGRLERIVSENPPFADIILEEKSVTIAGWLETFRDPKTQGLRGSLDTARTLLSNDDDRMTWKDRFDIVKFAMADKTRLLNETMAAFDALAAESRKPYTGVSGVPIPDNWTAGGVELIPKVRQQYLAREAELSLFQLEVALRRYRASIGRYPAQLADLVPHYLRRLPHDPFGGGASIDFRYRTAAGRSQFTAYSLGPDLRDDLGKLHAKAGIGPGDIVVGSTPPPSALAKPLSGSGK